MKLYKSLLAVVLVGVFSVLVGCASSDPEGATKSVESAVGASGVPAAISAKFTEGGCCDKAEKAGKACDHPCCKDAIAAGTVCEKCNKG